MRNAEIYSSLGFILSGQRGFLGEFLTISLRMPLPSTRIAVHALCAKMFDATGRLLSTAKRAFRVAGSNAGTCPHSGHRNRPSFVVYAAGWRGPYQRLRAAPRLPRRRRSYQRSDVERGVLVEELMRS